MEGVRYRFDDSELRDLLRNLKGAKKEYRRLANDVLQELREDVAYATHVDTGQMQSSWEVEPLKMKDSGYHVMGTLSNDAQKPWHKEPYPSYEIARGGSHDAIAQGLQLYEMKINDKLGDLLEGLLR